MTMWILELYDNWFACPVTIGVYSTQDKAETAYDIVMRQLMEKDLEKPEERYNMAIVPIQTDSFIDTAMAWIGSN